MITSLATSIESHKSTLATCAKTKFAGKILYCYKLILAQFTKMVNFLLRVFNSNFSWMEQTNLPVNCLDAHRTYLIYCNCLRYLTYDCMYMFVRQNVKHTELWRFIKISCSSGSFAQISFASDCIPVFTDHTQWRKVKFSVAFVCPRGLGAGLWSSM